MNNYLTRTAFLVSAAIAAVSAAMAIFILAYASVPGPLPVLTFAAVAIAALFAPRVAVCAFLMFLPLFGQRPGSQHSLYLFIISAALQLALPALYLRGRCFPAFSRITGSPVAVICSLYFLVCCFSISGLPLSEFYHDSISSLPSAGDPSAVAYLFLRLVRSTEETLGYSILSIFWTGLAFNLAVLIFVLAFDRPRTAVAFASSIFAALAISLLSGLLDYYGLVSLESFRPLDPVVNPYDVQFRLQSFFGHSGWFAEFLTLTVPFVLVVLLLPAAYWIRVSLILLFLLAGEYALVLTFQRGGWVSYPLTLFVIWAALYITRRFEKGDADVWRAFRRSLIKVLISLPLTLLITFGVLTLTLGRQGGEQSSTGVLSRYGQRFAAISNISDRSGFIIAGFKIGSLSPLLGTGSESFAFQFQREFRDPQGAFHGSWDWPLYGSAHNVYAQTFAGKGAIGLLLLLTLLFLMSVLPLRQAVLAGLPFSRRVVLLSCAAFSVAFLIYGNVQEIFYVQPLQFYFFAVLGIALASLSPAKSSFPRWPALVVGLAIIVHLSWLGLSRRGVFSLRENASWGCFQPEQDHQKQQFRWCGPRARLTMPLNRTAEGRTQVHFQVRAAPRDNSLPEVLVVSHAGVQLHKQLIYPGRVSDVLFELPGSSIIPSQEEVSLLLRTALYLIPARDFKASSDLRALSYSLLHLGGPLP